jgi:hypothetical protein
MDEFEYRDKSFFNEEDTYEFKSSTNVFKSKVDFDRGGWTTIESLRYKAETLPCRKL